MFFSNKIKRFENEKTDEFLSKDSKLIIVWGQGDDV